ncbi:MAG: LuxR C-terminal-related transcriptional regulator [Clostridia bacterium]|nr:LuxR C-terminal-related transcriptional regulator [Clostridia bacterium]
MEMATFTNSIHYYSDKLKAKLAGLINVRTTLVEAPSGYGKTTAVRDTLTQNLSSTTPVIWFTAQDKYKESAWERLCYEITKIDDLTGKKLISLGYPNKGNLGMVADAFFNINCDMKTYLVIDNFHLLQKELLTGVIQALFEHGGKNLHLILIRQYIYDDPVLVYSISLNITASDLCLSETDIYEYYTRAGITVTKEQIADVYAVTEGWVVAVYLQMLSYLETGSFAISSGTMRLMHNLVWHRLNDDEKEFLLRIHAFNSITLQQACFLLNTSVLPAYAARLLEENHFIKKNGEHYELHTILSVLLREEFEALAQTRKIKYLMRTALWHKKSGNTLAALSLFYSLREYDEIFSLDLSCLGFAFVDEKPYAVLMSNVVNTCPIEIKRNYSSVLLTIASQLYSAGMEEAYTKLMLELRSIIDDTEELFGEWLLVSALPYIREPEQLIQIYKQAAFLLTNSSKNINVKEPYRAGTTGPCGLWLRRPGEADRTLTTIKDALAQYTRCVPDHVNGQTTIFEAELYYLRGEIDKAEVLAYKASYLAKNAGKDILLMDAARILAHIAIHNNDLTTWNNALDTLEQAVGMNPMQSWLANSVRDLLLSELYCSIGLPERMIDWLKNGEFSVQTYDPVIYGIPVPYISSRYFPPFCIYTAQVLHCLYLYHSRQFKKLLGAVGSIIETCENSEFLLLNIYYELFRMGAYWELGRTEKALSSLVRACDLALPDRLYLLLAEFFITLNEPMEEYLRGRDLEALKHIKMIAEHLDESWLSLNETFDQFRLPAHLSQHIKLGFGYGSESVKDALAVTRQTSGLTEREYEIACLAAQGLRNKEIAEMLFISPGTVRSHLSVIFQKLEIDRRSMIRKKLL